MAESNKTEQRPDNAAGDGAQAISIVQRGNLKTVEKTLRKQWRMGQNIVLCWSADERGILVVFVPHYFLGNYCADGAQRGKDQQSAAEPENEAFIRDLISGERRKSREEMFATCDRLKIAPTFIKLQTALTEEPCVLEAVEELIRRYGLSYVQSRAVLLFDIVEFTLFTPFEQASQLNSLSYSLNSAYTKLLANGIKINFARTTTGDGYYIWNRDLGPEANRDLFYFMSLVIADNAVARAASRGNTVPVIRTAYHIGGHYELYQAEGVNPTMFSYIVGDVTIELARMVDLAVAGQILIGEFQAVRGQETHSNGTVTTPVFVAACDRGLSAIKGTLLSSKAIDAISCYLTEAVNESDHSVPRRFRIVDKHGLSRFAYNMQLDVEYAGHHLVLGLGNEQLPGRASQDDILSQDEGLSAAASARPAATAEDAFESLASLLQQRNTKSIVEE